MDQLLNRLPLAGPWLVAGLALATVAVAVLARRGGKSRRRAFVGVAGVLAVLTGAVIVNTAVDAYPTVEDALGRSPYPLVERLHPTSQADYSLGAAARIDVPDTASGFGDFDAQVWLPPQYFTEPQRRFPVVVLAHGNPGRSTDWLDDGSAAATGLAVARRGTPVILVMPTVLQEPYGDSLCLDTASQGNAQTYLLTDVIAAADRQLRTLPDAAHRGLGGFSMGGYCALNLGLLHPDLFSVVLSFSALTVCQPDAIDGGTAALFGTPDWQARADANSPAVYYPALDAARGPALWLDVGEEEATLTEPLQTLAGHLRDKGYAVELHVRPGGHDFGTWTSALQESLPWAADRLSS